MSQPLGRIAALTDHTTATPKQAYLQASFYTMAAFGTPLPADLLAGGPAATGGQKGSYSPAVEAFAAELAHQAQANVRTLRASLGDLAAPAPAIDISVDGVWNKLAEAAFNKTSDQALTPAFDPYANDVLFLHAAFVLQDVSVASLRGVSPVAVNDEAQSLVAGLLGANAYAGGSVRTRLASRLAARTPWGATVADVVDALSSLRQRLSDQAGGNASQVGASLAARRSDIPLWVPSDVDIPSISDARQIIQQRLMDARNSAQQQQQQQSGGNAGAGSQQGASQQQQGMNAAAPGGSRRLMQASTVSNPNAASSQQQQQQQQQPSGSGDTSAQEQQARVRQNRVLQVAAVDPATGLAFSRTPDQTLGILYGTGSAQQPGGFFPQGINGQMK